MKIPYREHIRIGVRLRLISIFLISVLTPMIIFGLLMFYSSRKEFERESSQGYTQMARQIGMTFSEYISRVDQITRTVDNIDVIPKYLRYEILVSPTVDSERLGAIEKGALEALKQLTKANDGIYSLSVVTLDGAFMSCVGQKNDRSLADFRSDYYEPLINSTGNTVILPTRDSQYLFSPAEPVFTVASKYIGLLTEGDINASGYTGYIVAECSVSTLAEFCGNVDMGPGSSLYILDQNNRLCYSTTESELHKKEIPALYGKGVNDGKIMVAEKEYMLVSSVSPDTGWTILATVPYENVVARTNNLKTTFVLLCLVSIVIITLASIVISNNFTKPIRTLQSAMKQTGSGNLTAHIEHTRMDEFGDLNDGFNKLNEELNVLIHNISVAHERENAAKYQMLQSQINPHFLYNTLDTIRMMAVLEDKPEIAEVLLHMSSLFRYHVRESGSLVVIREELSQAKNYLYLQKLRHQEQLEIVYDIDETALSYKTPKILLQPLLENAFSHGFVDLDRVGILTISIRRQSDGIRFSVTDNGRGMSEEALKMLSRQLLSSQDSDKRGIGLSNVNERLRIYFSEASCLKIDSSLGVGTTVSFTIPLLDNAAVLFRKNGEEEKARE